MYNWTCSWQPYSNLSRDIVTSHTTTIARLYTARTQNISNANEEWIPKWTMCFCTDGVLLSHRQKATVLVMSFY